jgi:hypothetical protein
LSLNCSICGSSLGIDHVEYIRSTEVVCRSCYPMYYVKHCPVLRSRIINLNHPSCNYCRFKPNCDTYLRELRQQ